MTEPSFTLLPRSSPEETISRRALELDPELHSAFLHLMVELSVFRERDRTLLMQMAATIAGSLTQHSFSVATDAVLIAREIVAEVDRRPPEAE